MPFFTWRDQWERLLREVRRFIEIAEAHMPGSALTGEDAMVAAAMHCYHLRDWLMADGLATKAELDTFVMTTPVRFVGDLANGQKHHAVRLRRPWAHNATVAGSGAGFVRQAPGHPPPRSENDMMYGVFHWDIRNEHGDDIDAELLLKTAVDAWYEFLVERRLLDSGWSPDWPNEWYPDRP